MPRIRPVRSLVLFLVIAASSATTVAAQEPVYVSTGSLAASVDGEPVAFGTFVTVVPELAEPIEDARARALAGRLAGREVATATTITTEPLVMNDVVIMPATVTLELRGSVGAPERGRDDLRELVLGLRIDPDTLAWTGDPEQVSVAYHPERWSGTAYYQLSELHLLELIVERTSDTTLRASGRLEATLVWREGAFRVTVDADRTVALVVDIDVETVVGDAALAAALGQ